MELLFEVPLSMRIDILTVRAFLLTWGQNEDSPVQKFTTSILLKKKNFDNLRHR
jgi:hypothetical protein